MNRRALITALSTVFALVLALPAAAGPHQGPMRDDGIHMETWMEADRHDLAQAAKDAEAAGKTLLVVVEGPGCTACAAMHAEHFSDPKYAAFMKKNFVVHLVSTAGERKVTDFDGTELSEQYYVASRRVRGTPTLMFFNGRAEEFFRIPGLPDGIFFRAFMDYVADGSAAGNMELDAWWAANEEKVRARHNI